MLEIASLLADSMIRTALRDQQTAMRPNRYSFIDRATQPIRSGARAISSLLLLVTVIQAITPDLNNLASSRTFDMLSHGTRAPGSLDKTWTGDSSDQDFPGIASRDEGTRKPGLLPIASIADVVGTSGPLGSRRRRPPQGSGPPLFDLLCHLTC